MQLPALDLLGISQILPCYSRLTPAGVRAGAKRVEPYGGFATSPVNKRRSRSLDLAGHMCGCLRRLAVCLQRAGFVLDI